MKQEVQRFRTLRFWEDLDPKLPESLYHFHPVRFVECFVTGCVCGEAWRIDKKFLEESEGRVRLDGYVPRNRDGTAIGQSGVTISTGIDLGQQSRAGTRAILDSYIAEFGNENNVDIETFLDTLNPYFSPLRKKDAIDKLRSHPLRIELSQAELLAEAFRFNFCSQINSQFKRKNTLNMMFKKLPTEAQTAILDFAYQYGLSDIAGRIRETFWGHVYKGEWKKLADWLEGGPDRYRSRRSREAKLIQRGINENRLPELGNPCRCAY